MHINFSLVVNTSDLDFICRQTRLNRNNIVKSFAKLGGNFNCELNDILSLVYGERVEVSDIGFEYAGCKRSLLNHNKDNYTFKLKVTLDHYVPMSLIDKDFIDTLLIAYTKYSFLLFLARTLIDNTKGTCYPNF